MPCKVRRASFPAAKTSKSTQVDMNNEKINEIIQEKLHKKLAEKSNERLVTPYRFDLDSSYELQLLTISSGESLPHWECNHAVYHVTFRLADSVPRSVCEQWIRERDDLIANAELCEKELSEEMKRKADYLFSKKIDKYLDVGHGKCYLRDAAIAKLVEDALVFFDPERYRLHAWCIMPNHVHVIVEIMPGYALSTVVHSWKSYTANKANKILGVSGTFWQADAYNHIIRSKKEYDAHIQYVWRNPEKAGMQNWQWRGKRDTG
jgi:REP element-mobilizing transposase RayT